MTFVSVMKHPDSLKLRESRSIYDVKMSMFFVVHQKPLSTLTKGLMGLLFLSRSATTSFGYDHNLHEGEAV